MGRISKMAVVVALVLAGAMSSGIASTVDFVPTTGGPTTYLGNVGNYFETQPGLMFTVGAPGDSVTLNGIGVFVGETQRPSATLSLSVHSLSTGSIDDTLFVGYQQIAQGPADWRMFDVGSLLLPYAYSGASRTNYLVRFAILDGGVTEALQYFQAGVSNPAFWDQDGFNFIYGMQGLSTSRAIPAVRFELANTAAVPLPAAGFLGLFGLAGLALFSRFVEGPKTA